VRTRFGLSEADVRQLQDWLLVAGVRWGLDAAHRSGLGFAASVQADLAQNTWAFGLRRLLLGYALGPVAWRQECRERRRMRLACGRVRWRSPPSRAWTQRWRRFAGMG
jgi:exonuclease V gamma subunit